MSDKIVQELGFDAQDAINELDRLGKSISKVSGRLTRFGKNIDRFNQLTKSMPAGFFQATTGSDKLGKSMERTEKYVARLTTSTELLSRILYTQLVIKGFRLATQSISEATDEASKLQVKVAEISGVANKGTFSGGKDITDSVNNLSKSLGIPQLEVADGLYSAIQNQIGKTKGELIDFNKVAGEFSVASITDQNASIELLSSTLNSYGLGVSRTEEIASKFNKAIELGNISGTQLAHVMGRVSQRANALGVSLDDTLGLFETLTIRGVNPNEAATQIGALISSFTKPSEAMKKALERLNVPSGEFLVRMKGIAGALESVSGQTDGTSAEIAKLFPNIRAVNGVAITTADNFALLNQNIEATRNTARSLNKERFELIFNTDAKKVEREVNTLRIEMSKIGDEVIRLTAQTFDYVGGAESVIRVTKTATPAIVGLTTAFTLYHVAAKESVQNTELFGKSVGGILTKLGNLALIAGVAKAAVNFTIDTMAEKSLEGVRRVEKERAAAFEQFKKEGAESLRIARDIDSERNKLFLAASQEQLKIFSNTNKGIEIQEKSFVTTTENALDRITNLRKEIVREIERAVSDSQKTIESSQRRVVDLLALKGQRKFDAKISGLSDSDQVAKLLARSTEQSRTAQARLNSAKNNDQITQALKLFSDATSSADQAKSIAERVGSRNLEAQAVSKLNSLTDKQVAAEKRLQRVQDARRTGTQKDLEAQKKTTDEVAAQAKIITQNLSVTDQTPADAETRKKTVQDAFQKLSQSALSKSDISLADSLGLTQLAADIQRNLGGEIQLGFNTKATITSLQDQMSAAFANYKLALNFDVSGLEKVLGESLTTPAAIATGRDEAKKRADDLRTEIQTAKEAAFQADTARKLIPKLLATTDSAYNVAGRVFSGQTPGDLGTSQGMIKQFKETAEALNKSSVVTKDQVNNLFSQLSALKQFADSTGAAFGSGLGPDIDSLSQVVEQFNAIRQAGEATLAANVTAKEEELRRIETVLSSTGSAATRIEESLNRGATRLEQAAQAAANALNRIGGSSNFATGGMARGSDTVSAMLSPGETVVNARQSQRFFSDLQRINAGVTPQYRSAGGPVDNSISVGDVHIHGTNQTLNARDVARAISREVRRKTI